MRIRTSDFLISLHRGRTIDVFTTMRDDLSDSENPYSGFSLCDYTGDSAEHTALCRHRLAEAVGVEENDIVMPRQTHGSKCVVVAESDVVTASELYGVDALVTSCRGKVIGVNTADCLPVVLIDEINGVSGVAHAGWRGALAGVVQSALDGMLSQGASLDSIEAFMGPCICAECFEVGDEVASQFPAGNVKMMSKPHVDLAGYVADLLESAGIKGDRIHRPKECTKCNSEKYFSARASGVASGRNFTFAVIKG